MGEQLRPTTAEKSDTQDQHSTDASEKLRLSLTHSDLVSNPTAGIKSTSDQTMEAIAQYKAGRYALVTAEGLSLLPSGVLNGVRYDIDHPYEFAVKMGTAAAMGVGMRLLLPEAGAARAFVGTAMTYFMARDALMPVVHAWGQVSDPTDLANIHDAATRMSNGLGLFAVDTAAGLPIGLAADKLTGYTLNHTAAGRKFEFYKDTFYNSNKSPVGRFFNWTQNTADDAAAALAAKANKMADSNLKDPKAPSLSLEEKLRLIKENGGADGESLSVAEKLDIVKKTLDGENIKMSPEAEAVFKAYLEHKRWLNQDWEVKLDSMLQGREGLKPGTPAADTVPKNTAAVGTEGPGQGITADKSNFLKATDAAEKPAAQPATPLDRNAETVSQMSTTMRDRASRISEVDKKIANFRESVESSLAQTMRSGKPPLDPGHFDNNKALIDLTTQLQTPDDVKAAGFLLEHYRAANQEMGIPDLMPEIVDLNQYSRSVHRNLMNLLKKEGMVPSDVLRGSNSPIFLIFDSKGAGPYTIPAIKGVTDTAVIVLPREYQQMLGVHVAGLYAHELGHDLIYGDLLRFPENLRNQVLRQDVVAEAMKSKGIADVDLEVPGHGTMKKSEFFTKLLLAEANENTADIFGTAIDPNTPLALATLFGSLRNPPPGAAEGSRGQLETRSMYGQDNVDPVKNPIGFQSHGIDAWRIKLGAEVLRQLSEHEPKVTAFANSLDHLSESLRRPGDNYIWASMDKEGEFVSVPMKEWDAIIPAIVKAQLETPLPALNNKMLRNVYPDVKEIFPKVDSLAERFAASARAGDKTVDGFNKTVYPIEDVFSAGLSGWMKAIAQNPEVGKPGYIAPDVLLDRMNGISQSLTSQYRGDNYVTPSFKLPTTPPPLSSLVSRPIGYLERGVGQLAATEPAVRGFFSNMANKSSIYAGMSISRDMMETEQRLQEMMKKQQKAN